jgi:hypothetical protein
MAAVRPYTSITTLNVNGLNFLIKGYGVIELVKNKTQLCVTYKKLTSFLKMLIDWKWRDVIQYIPYK